MISFLNNWIQGIALAVVIISIFEMILPDGNIKKYVKIILGIYVIFSIINPFVSSKDINSLNLEKEFANYYKNIETSSLDDTGNKRDLNKIYIETFEEEIIKAIEAQGYQVYKCNVKGNFESEKEKTGITSINIVLDSKIDKNGNSNSDSDELGETKSEEITEEKESNSIENVENIEKVEIDVGNRKENKKENPNNSKTITSKDITNLKKYLSEHYELKKSIINISKR